MYRHGSSKKANDTYKKTKGIFDKLWKNTFEDTPWLQLILQNALYAFIQKSGLYHSRLALVFHRFLLEIIFATTLNIIYRLRAIGRRRLLQKSRQTQEDQIQAAETRLETLLAHSYVYDILAQAESTIDFSAILEQRKIVLVRLSASLAYETRKIIGTLLISELLHAIERRKTRNQFCIFIDECQTFAAYEDMPILITQAPKYGIATTLIHQERYGQLLDAPPAYGRNLGNCE